MKVFHFGHTAQPLLGALHVPQRLRSHPAAILLCNPFGEEAARAHRIYRVLATQLERAGYVVLRFDYRGTGDSMGDGRDTSVAGWVDDIALATAELLRAARARHVVAIGLRLGGTLAALAASSGRLRLRHLIMWDPVIDGAAYLDELTAQHRAYTRDEMGGSWQDRLVVTDGVPIEVLGTPVGARLGGELAAIDLHATELAADTVTVISTTSSTATTRLRAQMSASPWVRWIDLPASSVWNSDAALNAAVVPMEAVQTVVSRVQEVTP